MGRRQPRCTRMDRRFPYTELFRARRTERVCTLVARGAIFEGITEDARVLALLDRLLQPGYLLTASQAIRIRPGETPQPIHYDDQFYRIPRPRPPISVSMIVAVDAFTAENGGTELLPGSHRRSEERRVGKECVSTCRYRGATYH